MSVDNGLYPSDLLSLTKYVVGLAMLAGGLGRGLRAALSQVLVTHGLAMRVFLMRWFHWTVDQLLAVENPPHAEPVVLERVPSDDDARPDGPLAWMHTKSLYRLAPKGQELLKGCTDDMCSACSPLYLVPRRWDERRQA